MQRCGWCQDEGILQEYHDREWGIPLHDDLRQFEFLTLEVMQCGLNWLMMLKKREIFRQCFAGFDFEKIAAFGEEDIKRILDTPGMIRSVRKINAVIANARVFREIREEYGSFDAYLWGYTGGKTRIYKSHQLDPVSKNELSDAISRDLKKRGMKYLGSITVYSHLQASGLINDHQDSCFMYREICQNYPVEFFGES